MQAVRPQAVMWVQTLAHLTHHVLLLHPSSQQSLASGKLLRITLQILTLLLFLHPLQTNLCHKQKHIPVPLLQLKFLLRLRLKVREVWSAIRTSQILKELQIDIVMQEHLANKTNLPRLRITIMNTIRILQVLLLQLINT